MKNLKALALILPTLFLLSACSYESFSEVEALNNAQPVGSPFTQRLATEYREFANTELQEMFDYPDALHFARKGLAAAEGEMVMPEPLTDWNLSPAHVQELGTARGRLINVLDLDARDLSPDQAAIAQVRFDCWIEQQEESWQADDISNCKTQFYAALETLEDQLKTVSTPAAPRPAADPTLHIEPTEPMQIENALYLVFFDFDRSTLTTEGEGIIDVIINELNNRADVQYLEVIGHTDTSGSKVYNQKLALRRAKAVMDSLVTRGIPPEMVRMESRGEDDLIVDTADNIREPANRRVSIAFGK